jgi:hypothetical protein
MNRLAIRKGHGRGMAARNAKLEVRIRALPEEFARGGDNAVDDATETKEKKLVYPLEL